MGNGMRKKHIRYSEGQWFAIPLRNGNYALGIIVRGSYKTKGGLGYFFGPTYVDIPSEKDISGKKPEDAILIRWFGDLGIISGRWPLIQNTRSFNRGEWPIPKFGRKFPLILDKGIVVEYGETPEGIQQAIRETAVDVEKIIGLPEDGMSMDGSIEIKLTKLLELKASNESNKEDN
jgi:hypothetical protein